MLDDIKEAMTRCRANESTIVGILNRSNHGEPLPGDILEVVGATNVDNAEALAPVLREAVARLREDYATVTEEVSTYARIFIGGGENPKKVIVAYKSAEADAVARVEFHSWLVASIADACTRFSKLQSSTAADTEDSKRETSSLAEGVRIYRWVYTNLFPDDISEQLERWGDCGSASLTGAKRPDATPPAASERTSKSPDAATSQCGTTPVYADSTTTSTELNPSRIVNLGVPAQDADR